MKLGSLHILPVALSVSVFLCVSLCLSCKLLFCLSLSVSFSLYKWNDYQSPRKPEPPVWLLLLTPASALLRLPWLKQVLISPGEKLFLYKVEKILLYFICLNDIANLNSDTPLCTP